MDQPPVPPFLTFEKPMSNPFQAPGDDLLREMAGLKPAGPDALLVRSRLRPLGGVARKAQEDRKPAEPEPEPLEIAATPDRPEEKPKAVLTHPKWEVQDVGFNEETDLSIEIDIPKSHAHKTKVSFELFAKTPNGPESISKADGQAKDGKARTRIPLYMPQYRDEAGNLLAEVEYYFTAKHLESDLFKDANVVKKVDHPADRLVESHILQDVVFATGKSLPWASQAGALKSLGEVVRGWRDKHPDEKLAIFGHADGVGKERENKIVSERRARAIHAFLVKDPKAWEALYGEENCGLSSTQEFLKHLGHDPGAVDGVDGPKTQAAVKAFQGSKGLTQDGKAGPKTRETLYSDFMEACQTPQIKAKDFDSIDGHPFVGCSEFNQMQQAEGACEANRRVAVLLLKSNRNFPIQYPCKAGDVGPCQKQTARKGERKTPGCKCLFYDQLVQEAGNGADGKALSQAFFENASGEGIDLARAGSSVFLVLQSSNMVGEKIDIDLSDASFDFERQGEILQGGILKNFEIIDDTMKIELGVRKARKA